MSSEPHSVLFRPPYKITIVESIVDQIMQQVQEGALQPGDRLPSERRLIEILGVSRSSVREALQGLTVMGLVEIRPGQGTFIASRHLLSSNNADLSVDLQHQMRLDYIEARREIECPITRLAAVRRTEEEIARLKSLMEACRLYEWNFRVETGLPSPHHALHLLVAEMTHNPFNVLVAENLMHAVPYALRLYELRTMDSQGLQQLRIDQTRLHGAIVRAINDGDGHAAYDAMNDHMDYELTVLDRVYGTNKAATL